MSHPHMQIVSRMTDEELAHEATKAIGKFFVKLALYKSAIYATIYLLNRHLNKKTK